MAIDIAALQAELLAGHPATGAYNVDNRLAADELNALNRDAAATPEDILQYMILERYRQNTGGDTAQMFIYGRVELLANAADGDNVFGASPPNNVTLDQIASAKTMIRVLGSDSGFALSLLDGRFDAMLNDLRNAGCFSNTDKSAIQALSQNKQSRAQELGFGRVRVGDVERARA